MAFTVVVPAKSESARLLQSLQPPLRTAFWKKIRELQPASGSPATNLYATHRGQAYQFRIEVEGQSAFFTVIFQFADTKDENTLVVAEITITLL